MAVCEPGVGRALPEEPPLEARACARCDNLGHRALDNVLVRRALRHDRRAADPRDLLQLLCDRLRGHEDHRWLIERCRGLPPPRALFLVLGRVRNAVAELFEICGKKEVSGKGLRGCVMGCATGRTRRRRYALV